MNVPCGAIILAAGLSRRMGSNKLLARLDGKPLITHVVDAVSAAGLPALVVLGHAEKDVRAALAGRPAKFVIAHDYAEGIGRSIAAGIAAAPPEWQAAIICLGDMPLISPVLLRQLMQAASASAILIPTFTGRRGNPVLWGRDYFDRLMELRGDVGARTLLPHVEAHVATIYWTDDSIFRDFDTPDTLKDADQF